MLTSFSDERSKALRWLTVKYSTRNKNQKSIFCFLFGCLKRKQEPASCRKSFDERRIPRLAAGKRKTTSQTKPFLDLLSPAKEDPAGVPPDFIRQGCQKFPDWCLGEPPNSYQAFWTSRAASMAHSASITRARPSSMETFGVQPYSSLAWELSHSEYLLTSWSRISGRMP